MHAPPASSRRPASAGLLGAGVGAIAFLIYLKTLYPGLGGGGDVSKFQYLGGVLGTPHTPGYPLFILISYVFAHLPIGTPAFRINMMSAFFGAMAAAFVCVTLVRLRCHRGVAVAAALCLACDRLVWGKSTAAEVYTLGAALTAVIIWLAVRWGESGRDRDLYLTAGTASLALGNHLTIAMLAPALVAYVAVQRPRSIRPRTIAMTALIVLAGLSQYLFIVIRTKLHAGYLETRATDLRELWDVVSARPYADQIMAFTWKDLLAIRLPELWRIVVSEMNPAGVTLLGLGIVASAWRRTRIAVLLILGAIGVAGLTLNVDADVDGFLLPAAVMVWTLAGIGWQFAWDGLARAGTVGAIVGAATFVAMPAWQFSLHYRANDHHRRTYETDYMNALFAILESKTAIVREAYPIDQLILYKLVAEKAAGARTIEVIDADRSSVERYAESGYTVYAFEDHRAALESQGFRFAPVILHAPVSGAPAVDMGPLPLFRLERWSACAAIGDLGWRDVTKLASAGAFTVKIDDYRPFDAGAVGYLGGPDRFQPPMMAASKGPRAPAFSSRVFALDRPSDRAELVQQMQRDGVSDPTRFTNLKYAARFEFHVNDDGQFSLSAIDAGGAVAFGLMNVVVDLKNPARALVCNWIGSPVLSGATRETVSVGADNDSLFGQGWAASETLNGEAVRRTTSATAETILQIDDVRDLTLRWRARVEGAAADRSGAIRLTINDVPLQSRLLSSEWTTAEWSVPARALRRGLNRLVLDLSSLGGRLALINLSADTTVPGGGLP